MLFWFFFQARDSEETLARVVLCVPTAKLTIPHFCSVALGRDDEGANCELVLSCVLLASPNSPLYFFPVLSCVLTKFVRLSLETAHCLLATNSRRSFQGSFQRCASAWALRMLATVSFFVSSSHIASIQVTSQRSSHGVHGLTAVCAHKHTTSKETPMLCSTLEDWTRLVFCVLPCLLMTPTSAVCPCEDARDGLVALYDALGGDHWTTHTNWKIGLSVCDWYGVARRCYGAPGCFCVNLTSCYCRLDLVDNNLVGTLPREVWALPLGAVGLGVNRISGTIPDATITNNSLLHSFNVSFNSLTGSLPSLLPEWVPQLSEFDVQYNGITGKLPNSYGALVRMRHFHVVGNAMVGALPPEYSKWENAGSIKFTNNTFSGPLPESYGAWGARVYIFLAGVNNFTGTLPASYGNWTGMQMFEVCGNGLSGELPDYTSWELLQYFDASHNALSGSVRGLSYFRIDSAVSVFAVLSNRLTGELPATLPAGLRALLLHNNSLSGTVPLWSSASLSVVTLHNNTRVGGRLPQLPASLVLLSLSGTTLCGAVRPSSVTLYTPLVSRGALLYTMQPIVTEWVIDAMVSGRDAVPLCPAATTAAPRGVGSPQPSTTDATLPAVSHVLTGFGSLVSPTSGLSLLRGALNAQLGDCASPGGRLHQDVDLGSAPLRLRVLPSVAGALHRGAVVGNIVLWMMCASVGGAAVVCLRTVPRLISRENNDTAPRRSWVECAARLRLPGLLCLPVCLLLQQVVVSSMLLFSAAPGNPESYGIGCAGCVAVLCVLLATLAIVDPRPSEFTCVPRECQTTTPGSSNFLRDGGRTTTKVLVALVEPTVLWVSRRRRGEVSEVRHRYVGCFGVLFEGSKASCHWWIAADMCTTVVQGIVVGIASESTSGCLAQRWLCVAINVAWLVATCVCRPKHRRIGNLKVIGVAALQAVASLCGAINGGEEASAVLSAVSAVVSLVLTVTALAVRQFLFRRNHPNVSAGARHIHNPKRSTRGSFASSTTQAATMHPQQQSASTTGATEESPTDALRRLVAEVCDQRRFSELL